MATPKLRPIFAPLRKRFMDKNSIIGLFLIGVVIIGYTYMTAPSAEEQARMKAKADSLKTAQMAEGISEEDMATLESSSSELSPASTDTTAVSIQNDSLVQAQKNNELSKKLGLFATSAASNESEEDLVILENDLIRAEISKKGGQLKKVELKSYQTYEDEPLILFDEKSQMDFIFQLRTGQLIRSTELQFNPIGRSVNVQEGDAPTELIVRASTDSPDKYLDFVYTISPGSYELGFRMDFVGLGNDLDFQRNDLSLHWDMTGFANEKSIDREKERCSVFYRYMGEERDYLSETENDEEELEATTNWIAFKQNFFSAVLIHPEGFPDDNAFISIRDPETEGITKEYKAEITLPVEYAQNPYSSFSLYLGPNHYQTLKEYDNGMDRIIDLGWGIFGWMNKWLVIPIFNFLDNYIASYGVIILILTVLIKLLLFPLMYKNYLSSAKMRVLKPEIDELNKKFENEKDPMKKQQATMALYRKSGVNPAAGCVPMLIQMPILYAMFRFFPASIELRHQPFLWADDLSSYDNIINWTTEIPFLGNHLSLFTLLMALSTLIYTRMNSSQMPSAQPGMPNMKTIMTIFPIMMIFIFNSFASGLSYYYLLANLFSIGQMFVIKNLIIDEDKIRKQIKANQKKPVKKSSFQKRLEDAAKKRGYPTK